ncbi:Outer membrane putative beta-barrel porin/alpha-amylase [Flavobacterium longum]|uniref:transporter n=1 Tax=Flavobacterium longum TaxID=1299340 RepID=UPI0039EB23CA
MCYFRQAIVFVLLMATSLLQAQFTDVINSNRPGESMSPFSIGKTVIQAEAGLTYVNEDHNVLNYQASGFALDTDLRYGAFFEQLELILNLQYRFDKYESPRLDERRNGFNQIILGGKYLVFDPDKNYEAKPNLYSWKANHKFSWHDFVPSVAVYGGLNLNLFDNPFRDRNEKITPKLMVLTQNEFGRYVFVMNIFADDLASDYQSYGYVVTLTRGFNERWSGFVENQGFKGDYYSDGIFRIGAAYLLKENLQVDAAFGKNIKDTPGIFTAGIGVSWRFDENYEEVLIRAPKDKDEKKSKEDKKKEKEKKKRKDAIEGTEDTK